MGGLISGRSEMELKSQFTHQQREIDRLLKTEEQDWKEEGPGSGVEECESHP